MIPLTHIIHDHSLSWGGTGTSIEAIFCSNSLVKGHCVVKFLKHKLLYQDYCDLFACHKENSFQFKYYKESLNFNEIFFE